MSNYNKKEIRTSVIRAYKALVDSTYDPKDVESVVTMANMDKIAEAAEQGGGGEAKSVIVNVSNGSYKFHANELISLLPDDVLNFNFEQEKPTEYRLNMDGFAMFDIGVHCKQNEQEQMPADMTIFGAIRAEDSQLVNYSEAKTLKEIINLLDGVVLEYEDEESNPYTLPVINASYVVVDSEGAGKEITLQPVPITLSQFNSIIEKIN